MLKSLCGSAAWHEHEALEEAVAIELEPVIPNHADAVRQVYRRFGKDKHSACLNFGDCHVWLAI